MEEPYYHFTTRARIDKSINSLLGIVEGIAIDAKINNTEVRYLTAWMEEHREVARWHPVNELFPVVAQALIDGYLSEEERLNVKWLCEQLRSTDYYDLATTDLQRLHAILGGIIADDIVTEQELVNLSEWLSDHDHLRKCWPYDEVDSLITKVMTDRTVDPQEQKELKAFFTEFVDLHEKHTIYDPPPFREMTIAGVCASCPEIVIPASLFCFTGASSKYTRKEMAAHVINLGGRVTEHISPKLQYLVIGSEGNPCWAYACYGRKVEAAVNLRKLGHHLVLVHEHDFNDELANYV